MRGRVRSGVCSPPLVRACASAPTAYAYTSIVISRMRLFRMLPNGRPERDLGHDEHRQTLGSVAGHRCRWRGEHRCRLVTPKKSPDRTGSTRDGPQDVGKRRRQFRTAFGFCSAVTVACAGLLRLRPSTVPGLSRSADADFRGECRTFGRGDYATLPGMNNVISSGRRISNDYPYEGKPDWKRGLYRQSQYNQNRP
jgi:hypothetical protein